MLIALAGGLTAAALGFLFYAWLGFGALKNKSASELHSLTHIENDLSGPGRTEAKVAKDIVLHSRRHLIIGAGSALLALLALLIEIFT
jgi:hypothetical protein